MNSLRWRRLGLLFLAASLAAQTPPPAVSPARPSVRPGAPAENEVLVRAVTQDVQGKRYRLRGAVHLEITGLSLKADEVDYDEETGYVEARGNVVYQNFDSGERLTCDRAEYWMREERGQFYRVTGSSPPKVETRPGILTSTSPFSFQAKWAERIGSRYVLHEGFITNCKLPRPWWRLHGRRFDVVPDSRAISYRAWFRLKGVPLFYTPYFFKSLAEMPRRSGFLTPNIGTSSRRGTMLGLGYYWAINRSHDLMYRGIYFSQRGLMHNVDMRGKPSQGSDYNLVIYGINDRGLLLPGGERRKQGGYTVVFNGLSDLGKGWTARAQINYLSSFEFRQSFTETFNEATFSEVNSIATVTKQWGAQSFYGVFQQNDVFLSTLPDDRIAIRRIPAAEFTVRDRQLFRKVLPVWFSMQAGGGLVRRRQPLYETRRFVERLDAAPRLMTALRWKDFHLLPSFTFRETYYGEQFDEEGRVTGRNRRRNAHEIGLDLVAPSLAKIFAGPGWLRRLSGGEKFKHVVEPTASFRYVGGVHDFNRIIRFDETELLHNTNEAEFSVVNRIYVKRKGVVTDWLSWQVAQRRFFDPEFGGAVIDGRRNVLRSSLGLSPYAFLDGARTFSPVMSVLRFVPVPTLGIEWRADYDPLRQGVTNSTLTADSRFGDIFVGVGHNQVRTNTILSPSANQLIGRVGYGSLDRRGWNAGSNLVYDFRLGVMQFITTQVSYNTDCCGLSVQYRRFGLGTRNDNVFLASLAIANIGSFGTLRKLDRMF